MVKDDNLIGCINIYRQEVRPFTDKQIELVQFINQDPVFWEIGITKDGRNALANPQTANSYSYAAGNPITGKDPDGRAVYLSTFNQIRAINMRP